MATRLVKRIEMADIAKLSDKMRAFAREYVVDYKKKDAAIRAGCSPKSASQYANKMLKNPYVLKLIGRLEKESQDEFEIERGQILVELANCALRTGKDFVDKNGKLVDNILELSPRAQSAIDSIKQKVRTWVEADGTQVEEVETELKLVPKGQALEMAMKHKGLFAAEKHQHTVASINWDELYAQQNGNGQVLDSEAIDHVELAIEQVGEG